MANESECCYGGLHPKDTPTGSASQGAHPATQAICPVCDSKTIAGFVYGGDDLFWGSANTKFKRMLGFLGIGKSVGIRHGFMIRVSGKYCRQCEMIFIPQRLDV